MPETQLRAEYEARRPQLAAWGEHVRTIVLTKLRSALSAASPPRGMDDFLKVPATFRVKDVASFMAKALHRGKGYRNPMEQITDQVGVRFVVLLSSETALFGPIIQQHTDWEASQDRDFERERVLHPHSFEYESDHFVVRAKRPIRVGEVDVPLNMPCEIQVRTLLQHAYAELSHDRLYKPECKVPDQVRRLVARGSALLETTDHMFCEVSRSLDEAIESLRASHVAAETVARAHSVTLQGTDPQVSFALLRQWGTGEITVDQLETWLRERDYVLRLLKKRTNVSLFYAHPVGLLGYMMVHTLGRDAQANWPFDGALFDQIAADLGIGLPG